MSTLRNIILIPVNISLIVGCVMLVNAHEAEELQKSTYDKEQHMCLAKNIYHEARSESIEGQKATAYVVMNRIKDKNYPSTVCDVVYDSVTDTFGLPIKYKCQFSWYCDGKSDKIKNDKYWTQAQEVAKEVLLDYNVSNDITGGAVMYHADYVSPYWTNAYEHTVKIDTHIFYKDPR